MPENKKNCNDIHVRINSGDSLYSKLGFVQPYMLQHITSVGSKKKDQNKIGAEWDNNDLYCPPPDF